MHGQSRSSSSRQCTSQHLTRPAEIFTFRFLTYQSIQYGPQILVARAQIFFEYDIELTEILEIKYLLRVIQEYTEHI